MIDKQPAKNSTSKYLTSGIYSEKSKAVFSSSK